MIDSHTHWGPSVTMGIEVTTEELLRQAEQSGVSQIVIFPFPSMALADEGINERLLDEANRRKNFYSLLLYSRNDEAHSWGKGILRWEVALDAWDPGLFIQLPGFGRS